MFLLKRLLKMFAIIICRASEVVKLLDSNPGIAAVLSIEHPGAVEDRHGAAPRLAGTSHAGVDQKILTFWDSEQPVAGGPDREQVKAGLDFVMAELKKGDVIIHCHAGKARSTAIALGAVALQHPEKTEKDLVDMLIALRPQAAPNILVMEMIDEMTGRGGKLLQAVLDHPGISAARTQAEANRRDIMRENPEYALRMFPEKTVRPENNKKTGNGPKV